MRFGVYCPYCGSGTNENAIWLGRGIIKCLKCGGLFNVGRLWL